jgi:hypothetical protein
LEEAQAHAAQLAGKLQEAEASRDATQQAGAADQAAAEEATEMARKEAEGLKAQLDQVGGFNGQLV